MRFKIDGDGCFWIERAGEWKQQECRPSGGMVVNVPRDHGPSYEAIQYCYCGDRCPLFREPDRNPPDGRFRDVLKICHADLYGEIIDERKCDES